MVRSADIIKTGGEKVSALEIEREMLSLPQVSEVAVVGLPSEAWGQKVAAVVMLSEKGKTAGARRAARCQRRSCTTICIASPGVPQRRISARICKKSNMYTTHPFAIRVHAPRTF